MVTKEALDAIGIKSSEKEIQPDWWFITLSFLMIMVFVFLVIGMFLHTHNMKIQ